MSFTHLQVRSGYTLFGSTIRINDVVKKAKDLNYDALALTDESVLYGAIPFYQACRANGIKPILGMIVKIYSSAEKSVPCILLAKSNTGYEHLMQISTYIQQEKQSSMSADVILPMLKEIIGILPVGTSLLSRYLKERNSKKVTDYLKQWDMPFGEDDFYLGIDETDLENFKNDDYLIQTIQDLIDTPIVAIQDVRYLEQADHDAYECLRHIELDQKWAPSTSNVSSVEGRKYLRSQNEMNDLFVNIFPNSIKNTQKIKRKCNVTFNLNKQLLPTFPTPKGMSAREYLEQQCFEKITHKYEHLTTEVTKRLQHELKVIQSMNFSDYFLIVADFIAYAKKKNILVGPGRGSAAGSIVAYILGITNVDPIRYNLLFERFLNPERSTMPDIDVDFPDHRRDEVIDYVRHKYGSAHVAQIITFGTFGVRSTLRELFKTMSINEQDANFILSEMPNHGLHSIAYYVRQSQNLTEYIKQSTSLRKLFLIATKLQGLPRHISTHAAGVVISDEPLIQHTPLTTGANGHNLTQYTMTDLEVIGLLKMDFLGLRNLAFIEQVVKSINHAKNKQIDLDKIPLNDDKTFVLLQKGLTNGVFQLESAGMKNVLVRLKPSEFEDIVAVNALYRPGPMDNIPLYIKNKHNPHHIDYLHELLQPILEPTYGVLIYQEQIMQIAHEVAGFTLGEADIFRRIISKKEDANMQAQKQNFIKGCIQNGLETPIAEKIFKWIVKFSNYGFNRSHAVAYSKISYHLAYLKAQYPTFFFGKLLSGLSSRESRIHEYIREANTFNISILAPSINKSFINFSVEKDNLRMGLKVIQGIGHHVINEILNVRKQKEFTSLFDFCLRISLKVVNRKTIETLILAGAFDDIYDNRASLLASLDQAIDQGELFGGINSSISLLPNEYGIQEMYTQIEDFTQMKKLNDEKELLGVYVSTHPLANIRPALNKMGYVTIGQSKQNRPSKGIISVVIIQSIKKIRTKRGESMAFIVLSDESEDIDGVVFPALYRDAGRNLEEGNMVRVTGKLEERNNRLQWLLETLQPFQSESIRQETKQLFIKLTNDNSENALEKIKNLANKYPGTTSIIIYNQTDNKTYKMSEQHCISCSNKSLQAFKEEFGKENVVMQA